MLVQRHTMENNKNADDSCPVFTKFMMSEAKSLEQTLLDCCSVWNKTLLLLVVYPTRLVLKKKKKNWLNSFPSL